MRLFGSCIFTEPGVIRCPNRFEICWSKGIGFALDVSCEDYAAWPWMVYIRIFWLKLFLRLPFFRNVRLEGLNALQRPTWGFSADFGYCGDPGALHLHWNMKTKVLWWPWMYEQVRHEVRRADGSWVPFVGSWEIGPKRIVNATFGGKEPDEREVVEYPYRYVLENGTVQDRTAKVYVERRARRRRWIKWCPLFEKTTYAIDVEFSGEVGERTGTWKGGCIGCGYELRPGETAEQCLRRMERERKF